MKIKKLFVNHFGKLSNLDIEPGDGITVISGENESGKSTLHAFTGAMILGLERGRGRAAKTDAHTLFTPWDGGVYGGTIRVENGGETYSVTRNFSKDAPSCTITNETESRQMTGNARNLSKIFSGLNATSYQNTISVKQLSASTGGELADELKNHIINLRSAGSFTLDVTGAVSKLKSQRKKIEAGFSKPVQFEADELTCRITSMEEDLASLCGSPTVAEVEKKKADIENEIEGLEKNSRNLAAAIEKNDEALKNLHLVSNEDISELSEDINYVTTPLINYYDRHGFNTRKGALPFFSFMMFFLLLLTAIGAGLGLYFYFYKNWRLFSLWPFAAASLLTFAGFVFCLVNFISVCSFKGKCRRFFAAYEYYFGEKPAEAGGSFLAALRSLPDKYSSLLNWISEGKQGLASSAETIARLREDIKTVEAELDEAKQRSWQREQKEDALSSLRLRLDMLKEPLKKNNSIISEVEAINLAIETIENISNDIFESFGHFLEATTSELFSNMTDGAYSGVSINDDFDIFLLQNEKRVPLCAVSAGTLDQLYLALRLSCIEFLWPDQTMPLLLDDTFAMYDKDRLASTLSWLSENYSGQVLIFTCHQREEQILKNMNIPFTLVEL